jgi:addiction module HigA family antidote
MVRSPLKSSTITERTDMRIPSKRPPTRPGEMLLEEFIKPLGISQTELAEWIGVSYPRLNEIVNGRRGVTPDTALRLEQVFGVDAQFWLNLEIAWELYHAKHSKAGAEIRRIQRHPAMVATA